MRDTIRTSRAVEAADHGLLELAFGASPVAMVVGDATGVIRAVNSAFAQLLGRGVGDLVGRHFDEITHPDDVVLWASHEPVAAAGGTVVVEKRYLRADGEPVWVRATMRRTVGPDGRALGVGHVVDISAERAERARREEREHLLEALVDLQRELTERIGDTEALFALLVERITGLMTSADGAIVILPAEPAHPGGPVDRLVYVAAGGHLADKVGAGVALHDSLAGRAYLTGVPQIANDVTTNPYVDHAACVRTGVESMITVPLQGADGVLGVLKVASRHPGAFDADDLRVTTLLAHALSAAVDRSRSADRVAELLAEAVTARQGLAERTRLIESVSDAVFSRDLEGRITDWNQGAERIYGWSTEAAVGRDVDRLLATVRPTGLSRRALEEQLRRDGRWSGDLVHHHRDGSVIEVKARKALVTDPDSGEPVGVLVVATDVTARRAAERALAASEALFRSQFEHSAVGQAIRGIDDVFESVNPAFAHMLGYDDPSELVGRSSRSFARPEDIARRDAAVAGIVAGEAESIAFEAELIRRDGALLPVRFVTSVLRDGAGRPTRFISHFDDISERRRAEAARDAAEAELRARHDELEAANAALQRMNLVKSDLISLLGHEIKNPLSVLMMATEFARATWDVDAESPEDLYLRQVARSADRLQTTVSEVLGMVAAEAGQLTARPAEVVVADVVADVLSHQMVAAEVRCAPDLRALVQPEHLVQMLGNLVSNAVKYGGGVLGSRIEIGVRRVGQRVRLEVVDHGAGVPPDFLPALFDRFTRSAETAERAEGTGVGLYLVRELARANGGDITHRDTPGGGATFTIDLPSA